MELGKGKKNYISEGKQDFLSENWSIWELKIETASSTKIQIFPCRNKVVSNDFLLVKIESIFSIFTLSFWG